jgi:hypothetical protein
MAVTIAAVPLKISANTIFRVNTQLKHTVPSKFFKFVVIPVSFDLIGLCQVISGVILVQSVIQIRKFFKDRNDESYIDTASLCRHATCFGLYLLFVVIYYTTFTIYTLNPTAANFARFTWVTMFYMTGNLISEFLLCQIFWSLGTKIEKDEEA